MLHPVTDRPCARTGFPHFLHLLGCHFQGFDEEALLIGSIVLECFEACLDPLLNSTTLVVLVLMHDVAMRSGGFVFTGNVRAIYQEQGCIGFLLGGE